MKQYVCTPIEGFHRFEVTVPGSKSITNRALLVGALAEGTTVLRGVLFSDDSKVFMQALRDIGFLVEVNEEEHKVVIEGHGGSIPAVSGAHEGRRVYVGSAGTAARFLTALLALSGQHFWVESSEQMKKRPMEPLLRALEELGAKFEFLEQPYAFPFRICGREDRNPESVGLNIDASSQFLSALLLSGVMCREGVTVHLTGTRSARAYVGITMKMMEEFGCQVCRLDENTYRVMRGQTYRGREYQIEPDVSAACYFYAMSPLLHVPVRVNHVHFDSLQGDVAFIRLLEEMGCLAADTPEGIVLSPPAEGMFHGITADMSACSDQAITLAAIAPFAEGPTTINGIGHIRFQESDRIAAITAELSRMGIRCDERQDGITIYPGRPAPSTVETYDDHRMAMGFSLTGLRSPGIVIADPGCCRKTFEDYFEVLDDVIKRLTPA